MAAFEVEAAARGRAARAVRRSAPGRTDQAESTKVVSQRMLIGKNLFLTAFERGDGPRFFALWLEHVPETTRADDVVCRKLEFYVNMYFAVFAIHPHVSMAGVVPCLRLSHVPAIACR